LLPFSEELFYQILLYNFENFDIIEFEDPLSVKELLQIALENEESGWTPEDGPKDELVEGAINILLSKAPIIKEYFALFITDDGYLKTLPLLIGDIFKLSITIFIITFFLMF